MFYYPTDSRNCTTDCATISGMIGAIAVPIIQETASDHAANICAIVFSLFFPTYNLCLGFTRLYNNEFGRRACAPVDCTIPLFKTGAPQCCGNDTGNALILLTYCFYDRLCSFR